MFDSLPRNAGVTSGRPSFSAGVLFEHFSSVRNFELLNDSNIDSHNVSRKCTAFTKTYDDLELRALHSTQATEIELLKNLWQLLHTAVQNSHLDKKTAQLAKRTTALEKELQCLARDQIRPSVTLHAKSMLLLMELAQAHNNRDKLKQELGEFQAVLEEGKGPGSSRGTPQA